MQGGNIGVISSWQADLFFRKVLLEKRSKADSVGLWSEMKEHHRVRRCPQIHLVDSWPFSECKRVEATVFVLQYRLPI